MCNRFTFTDQRGQTVKAEGVGRCSSCATLKPRDQFYADKHRTSGLSSRCKACDKVWLKALPERSLANDLKALMTKHPTHRELIEDVAERLSA